MKTIVAANWLMLVILAFSGCTALSLERHTANQAMTASDMRYQLVVNTLAKLASNPGDLPGLGTVTDGTATLTDKANIDIKTALDGAKGFTSETLSGGMSRSPNLQWTIDTAYTPDQIRAAQAACQWVLTGYPPQDSQLIGLLKLFQIYDDLECLNAQHPGWFCTSCKAGVPKGCVYVSRCGDRYFWVAPGGLKGLSEFTLILADIATVSPASLFGNATVNIQLNDKPFTQQNIPFRYDPQNPRQIDFATQVVIYGVPNVNQFDVKWPELPWCGGTKQMYGAAQEQEQNLDALRNRPLQPSGPNPSRDFQIQQQQQQMQTQNYLSR